MTDVRPSLSNHSAPLSVVPSWVARQRPKTSEDAAFLSGAALAALHVALGQPGVPQSLVRDRLALRAAVSCVAISGRRETAGDLRDALHLMRPGDQPGPAGDIFLQWRRAVERPLSVKTLSRAVAGFDAERTSDLLDAAVGAPIAQAAHVIETVLTDAPRAETDALILGDAALARALGWDHLWPLLASGLKPRDLRKTGDDLRMACHRAIASSAVDAVGLAIELGQRADRLRSVMPKLRAKGAQVAVDMFMTRDALAPTALTPLMSDRAARRFCDRLVDLGVVHELTGRDAFRLYGV